MIDLDDSGRLYYSKMLLLCVCNGGSFFMSGPLLFFNGVGKGELRNYLACVYGECC